MGFSFGSSNDDKQEEEKKKKENEMRPNKAAAVLNDNDTTSNETTTSKNIFRDTPLRYLGYANEIGESFRYQFPKFVTPTYMLAFGYCFAEAASNGYTAWNNYDSSRNNNSNNQTAQEQTQSQQQQQQQKYADTAMATCDTLLWQCAASVVIPGATINLIVKTTRFVVAQNTTLPTVMAAWLPTMMGLSSIPFIIEPIDHTVDFVMDHTLRQWTMKEKEKKTE